jgi:pentose-5-phosphate-3-epimerase
MNIINAPSLANGSLPDMREQTRQLAESGADWFHVDIMAAIMCPISVIRYA